MSSSDRPNASPESATPEFARRHIVGCDEPEHIVTKINFKKTLKDRYHASHDSVNAVDVPEMRFLMIDGTGNTARQAP